MAKVFATWLGFQMRTNCRLTQENRNRSTPTALKWYVVSMISPEIRTLNSAEIREIGEILFGISWQAEMAKAIGVPRQSIGHYLRSGGVRGAQTAAIVGLVARMAARETLSADAQHAAVDARHAKLMMLLRRFDAR